MDALNLVELLIVNEIEGAGLAGTKGDYEEIAKRLASLYPKQEIIMTAGSMGAYYAGREGFIYQPIIDYPVVDTTDAGDTFIGYYLGTKNIRSRGAYDVATAASLYARMMPLFCYRAVAYAKEGSYPPVVADALGMLKVMQPEAVSAFSGIDMNAGRYVGFAKSFTGTDTLAVYQRAVGQFKNYSGYYPYYYFFGHPDVSDKSVKEEQEKGGIN